MKKEYIKVLSIAGSDSGGGAGIQADIKSISACGAYAATAVTAITSQNTLGVQKIHPVPIVDIKTQIESVLSDIGADAIKIGMLHSAEVIDCVVDSLKPYPEIPIILDPVMVATSGDRLLETTAIEALKKTLIPICELITPNPSEAEILLGEQMDIKQDGNEAVRALVEKFGVGVLLKSMHQADGRLKDYFYEQKNSKPLIFEKNYIDSPNTHGTGCSLSAAIAAFRASGLNLATAIAKANDYLHQAIQAGQAYQLGAGKGPVHHFYAWWK